MKGAKTAPRPTTLLTLIEDGYVADHTPAAGIGKPCAWCGETIDGSFESGPKWGIVPLVGGSGGYACQGNHYGYHDNIGGYHGWPWAVSTNSGPLNPRSV